MGRGEVRFANAHDIPQAVTAFENSPREGGHYETRTTREGMNGPKALATKERSGDVIYINRRRTGDSEVSGVRPLNHDREPVFFNGSDADKR